MPSLWCMCVVSIWSWERGVVFTWIACPTQGNILLYVPVPVPPQEKVLLREELVALVYPICTVFQGLPSASEQFRMESHYYFPGITRRMREAPGSFYITNSDTYCRLGAIASHALLCSQDTSFNRICFYNSLESCCSLIRFVFVSHFSLFFF